MTKMDNEEQKVKPCWPSLNLISVCGDHCFTDELDKSWGIEEEQTFPHKIQVGNLIGHMMSKVNQSIIVGQTYILCLKEKGWIMVCS